MSRRITLNIRLVSPISLLLFLAMVHCSVSFAQTCTTTLFAKGYGFEGGGAGFFFDRLPNGELFFGGLKNNHFIFHKTDNNGNPLWEKTYKYASATVTSTYGLAALDSNGNYFVNLDADCIGLLDANGNPVAARQMKLPFNIASGLSMGVLADNKKILLVKDPTTYAAEGYMLICFSADLSTIVWNKHFSAWQAYFQNIFIANNKIFVTGTLNDFGTLLCFDATNGDLLSKKTYYVDNKQTILDKVYPYANGYIVTAKYYLGQVNNHIILRLDKNLDLLNSYRLKDVWDNASLALATEPDGSFYGAWGTISHFRFYINNRDSVLWNSISTASGLAPIVLHNTPEGLILLGSDNWFNVGVGTYSSALNLSRSDDNGNFLNCQAIEQPFSLESLSCEIGVSPLVPRDTSLVTLLPASIIASDDTDEISEGCIYTSNCNTLSIIGNTNLCNTSTANFIAHRNAGCHTPVTWTLNSSNLIQGKLNDSTLSIQFLQSGSYTLIASLSTCQYIRDTITVTVTLSGQALQLGPDTSICPGNTITLNAGKGFASYHWQDGTTDSIYEVTQPGLYHVRVTDACGKIYRDTVLVNLHAPVPVSIGPDRTKCNSDTLHLDAPNGFLNYAWSPGYNINSTTLQNVIVSPLSDTTYTLKAEKTPGCFAYDTVHIKVYHSAIINLGPDTSFCFGDSVLFDAGNNFSSYLWSNNNTSASIIVKAVGTYRVDALSLNGCHSFDTVKVVNVFPNPMVTLDHNNNLCAGSNRMLDAGNFTNYLWSNGSTGQTISVNGRGIFSVIVTDNNGCVGYDTASITTLVAPPADFLPGDTVMCSYATLQIKPLASYNEYLWSNNANTYEISVAQPGTYWLQVKDKNNCTGKDTIRVSLKDCMTGFYMPTAFTPNQDGKNDALRPLLFGNVKQYHFTVYNRFGEVVFQTTELLKGWDGNYKGVKQNVNVFAWSCAYQFDGEKPVFEKGIVTLLR